MAKKPQIILFASPNGSWKNTLHYDKYANTSMKGIKYINPDELAKNTSNVQGDFFISRDHAG